MIAIPARAPSPRRFRARLRGSRAASMWKVTDAPPASAYIGAQRSGSSIIRWQSSGIGLTFARASTTGRPRVRFGTKWPSITSTWAQSALAIRASSASRLAKSADRMLGEICTADTVSAAEGG